VSGQTCIEQGAWLGVELTHQDAAVVRAGVQTEFFGFYAISSKFASIFGPLAFALMIDLTGSNRIAILSLALFFVVGITLLFGVDAVKGREQATTGR
jgi:UMF1 family MFS transporter